LEERGLIPDLAVPHPFAPHAAPGSAIKKPAKKLFRVLAGIGYKPKRLFATLSF
jgi:hypothetical protein